MRNTVRWALLLMMASGCGGKSAVKSDKEESAAAPATWSGKMHSLSQSLSELLPYLVSKARFNNEKNFEKIEEDTLRLRTLVHAVEDSKLPVPDPGMKAMSQLFTEDIDRAVAGLRSGNRELARQILRDTTSYCIQCHTQTDRGPEFKALNFSVKEEELPPVERAEFFAATRQFDRALAAYKQALDDVSLAKADPFSWEQAARSALAIVVRFKNDVAAARDLLHSIEVSSALPTTTRQALTGWKKTVDEWRKEKQPKSAALEARLKTAQSLIDRARKRQEFPLDHTQDVPYFRASALAHDVLQEKSRSREVSAQALLIAGIAAEATRDMNFWTLHETYYEQCILAVPHSELARKCFAHLKDSVTLGYTGSGGIKIPPEINRRLESFERLAAAQTQQQ